MNQILCHNQKYGSNPKPRQTIRITLPTLRMKLGKTCH